MNEENIATLSQDTPTPPKRSKWKELLKEVVIFAAIAFGIVLPFRMYIAEPYIVDGRSMDPTFETSDYLIVDKFSYIKGAPERNSVVVFKYPADPNKSFIKRIIGIPGDTVYIKDNEVGIKNIEHPEGIILDQSYVTHHSPGTYKQTLGPDEYYVMGDNRQESFDSRSWGVLEKKYILGEPVLRLYPFNKIDVWPGSIKE